MASNDIALLVGSLRKESLSRKVAKALIARAPRGIDCHIVEIGDLPLYNEDLEEHVPAPWSRFRTEIRVESGVLWVTPEYNRSIPGCLKNALDVGTRPPKENVFKGMPSAIVSVTPYKLGGLAANHALRQAFVFPDLPVMQQPEAYIAGAAELFDDSGTLKEAKTGDFLAAFMVSFARWVETIRGERAASPGFSEFMKERERAAAAYVEGDGKPVSALATRTDPATFFSPAGDAVTGASAVAERYEKDVHTFEPGGSTRFDVLHSASSGDLAYFTGFQIAEARLRGKNGSVPMKLRVTEIYRREDGAFRLVHRHADVAKEPGGERR
jgi:NAD(P)H-dependent FMN reductase/ketosteroid isomerase-like protein